jgi:hypothetical protein
MFDFSAWVCVVFTVFFCFVEPADVLFPMSFLLFYRNCVENAIVENKQALPTNTYIKLLNFVFMFGMLCLYIHKATLRAIGVWWGFFL